MPLSVAHRSGFVGSRFGRLTIVCKHGLDRTQHLLVECLCDCGNTIIVRWRHLKDGNTKSCGCICKERVIDILGQRFNRLLVVERAGSKPKSHALWLCLCDCGKTVVYSGVELRSGATQSCGCLNKEQRSELGKRTVRGAIEAHKRPYGVAACWELIEQYKRGAKVRHRRWSLTHWEAYKLFKSNCHYCDRRPAQICGRRFNNGKFLYNGIDRVDSMRDYTADNVVACCQWCNWIKGKHSVSTFYENVARIARFHPEILAHPNLIT